MSEIDVEKYRSGEMTHYKDPVTGIVWHNEKFVEQLKQENEELKQEIKPLRNPDVIRILTLYAGDLDLLEKKVKQAEQKLEKLEKIKKTIYCDNFHKFEKYCETLCSEAHHCYIKQVLEIIGE